jgi:hypothetical protein
LLEASGCVCEVGPVRAAREKSAAITVCVYVCVCVCAGEVGGYHYVCDGLLVPI